jgi:hypothetical protein
MALPIFLETLEGVTEERSIPGCGLDLGNGQAW